jgi:hypothetical protein
VLSTERYLSIQYLDSGADSIVRMLLDMHTDPGWGDAFPHVIKALFSRKRLLAVRPAISAARAAAIAPVSTAVVLLVALTVFGSPAETDYQLTGLIVGFTVLAAAAMVFRLRYGKLGAPAMEVDAASQFLGFATLLTALATVPTLSAFVCFFIGGGYLMYGIGALSTILLVLGPAMPGHAMAANLAAKKTPPVPSEDLWQAVLDPSPDQ